MKEGGRGNGQFEYNMELADDVAAEPAAELQGFEQEERKVERVPLHAGFTPKPRPKQQFVPGPEPRDSDPDLDAIDLPLLEGQ
jgi:hypothetical protein